MMGRHKWSVVLVMMIIFLSVFASKEEVKIIKVGLLVDLTSHTSQMGIQGRDAANYAVKRYNLSREKIEIQLVVKNTEGSSEKIIQLMEEFKDEKVKIVIGPYTSEETIEMTTFISSGDFLVFSPTASTDALANRDDYFIRTTGLGSAQGQLLADMTSHYGKDKNIAIIYDESNKAFILPAIQSLSKKLDESNIRISYIEPLDVLKENILFEVVDRIIKNKEDGVVYFGTGIKAADFLQTLQLKGFKGHKYLSMWSSTPELIPNSGSSAEGVYIVDVIEPDNLMATNNSYSNQFYNNYGFEPSYVAYLTDETMSILFMAIDSTNSDDPFEVKKAILSLGSLEGYGSKFSINKDGDSTRPFIPLKIKDGRLQQVD